MGFQIIDIEQRSPEWHEFRERKIGASDAAAILGVSPFETRLELWERLAFKKERKKTHAMQRGTELEPKALAWVNNKLKVNFEPKVIKSNEYPDIFASLDGFEMKGSMPFLLEIKCPGRQDHLEAVNGKVPDHFYPQVQHQMHVADVDEMVYCSFDGHKGAIVMVYRQKDYCKSLFREEMRFLARLINFDPPEPCDRDWFEITDSEAIKKAERRRELDLLIEELTLEKIQIEEDLKSNLDHPRCRIGNLRAQKILRKGCIDYDKIEELKGIDREKYRKNPTSYWKFT